MTELSRDAVALIHAVGSADGPSEESRARVRRQLALGVGLAGAGIAVVKGAKLAAGASKASVAAGSAAAVAATKLSTTVVSVALWAAAGGALGVSVMVPAVMLTSRNETPSAKTRAVSAPPSISNIERTSKLVVGEPSSVETSGQTKSASDTSIAAPTAAYAKSARAPSTAVPSVPAQTAPVEQAAVAQAETVSEVSLGTEMRLLQAAQRELAQKRGAAALALLDEHAAKFPKGTLSAERSAARVVALCALGRTSEARSLANAFLAAAPKSPLVPRIRESCAFAGQGDRVRK